mgnify:CR=1 FL=1
MTTDRDIDAVVDLVRSNDKLRQELGELRARLERSRETSAKWCNDAGHENIRAEKAEQQRDRMGEALRDALDIVLWMSSSLMMYSFWQPENARRRSFSIPLTRCTRSGSK